MSPQERDAIFDIIAELKLLAISIDPHLESDEMNTLWSQIGRLELLVKE
jgi:hypothetical protein